MSRVKKGRRFQYFSGHGRLIRQAGVLRRIKDLAIPPAWKDVWICSDPQGHLQATGRDQRGRKQSIYHVHWRELRDQNKYARLSEFARKLPQLQRQLRSHLKIKGLPREKVLATLVQLLQHANIRVGNEAYSKENGSYGLTTLQNRHVRLRGSRLKFKFKGKSGIQHRVDLQDSGLARIVRECQELPGQKLFQYVDEAGKRHQVNSTMVNKYIHDLMGEDFTAKDFRTWSATLITADELAHLKCGDNARQVKEQINQAIDVAAKALGNTRAICRKSYIHPAVISAFQKGHLPHAGRRSIFERKVIRLLEKKT